MKKHYCNPSLQILTLICNDILTQSGDTIVSFEENWLNQGGGF